MKILFLLLSSCVVTLAQAQPRILYFQPAPEGFASRKIPKTDLEADIRFWLQVMEESHVNLFHAISKESLVKQANDLLAGLPDSMGHAEATLVISQLAAALGEGHLGLASDPVTDSLYRWTAERFPYFLRDIDSSGFIVEYDLSNRAPKLSSGSSIISVNGYATPALFEKYARYYGGLDAWKKVSVKDAIRKLLFLDDIKAPFAIVARQGNDTVRFTVPGFTRQQADSINRVLATVIRQSAPFSLQFLPGNIALVDFNDMNGGYATPFAAFLDSSFRLISQKKAKGLIIDLRRNGGGDSGLGDQLISYFSGKSYRNVSAVKIRISKHGRAMQLLRGEKDPFEKWKDGSLYEYKVEKLTKPVTRTYRFTGKTAVLIGPATFSSANMLANAIRDYKLARVFGEPTAEPGNDFGEVFPFMLPRTHIVATSAMKMFVRANGDDKDFRGIQPDVFVKDLPADGDEAKEAAIRWILK